MPLSLHDSIGHCLPVGQVWENTHRGAAAKFTVCGFGFTVCGFGCSYWFSAQVHIQNQRALPVPDVNSMLSEECAALACLM